jgi:hypothetical protein
LTHLGFIERDAQKVPEFGSASASRLHELVNRVRYLAEFNKAPAQFVGDFHGYIARPALSGIEGNDADWLII